MNRSSGIFLHPTSLPSPFGIGDLGGEAYRWVGSLKSCLQKFWQVCPLGPTGFGDSPYQSLSSYAGNTLLISPAKLVEYGYLDRADIAAYAPMPDDRIDYGLVISEKEKLFHAAFSRFVETPEFEEFCRREKYWLDDFALYMVIKNSQQGQPWYQWKPPLRLRFPAALEEIGSVQRKQVLYHKFLQYVFHRQWRELRAYANEQGIRIIGDMPYYVCYDSADAWAAPDVFELDDIGNPLRIAGVPPDFFTSTGQLWGNPVYRWETMRADGYAWWVGRLRKAFQFCSVVRLDHFRGFESFWAVRSGSSTAQAGEWVKGPGLDFFNTVKKTLGPLEILAEDLGEITASVEELRRAAGFPGMKVLQFAFDGKADNPYLSYNITADSVIYTATHDNDTSVAWFENLDIGRKQQVRGYLGCGDDPDDFIDRFLRLAFQAPSELCIIPVQDVLALGPGNRMNTPGTTGGNWQWRMKADGYTAERCGLIRDYTRMYGRSQP